MNKFKKYCYKPLCPPCYSDLKLNWQKYARRLRRFFVLERATIAEWQGASEDKKDAAEPTQQILPI